MIGPKPPLRPGHVWAIRAKLHLEKCTRDLAMFNLAGGSLEEFLSITSIGRQATVANVKLCLRTRRQALGCGVVEYTLAIENGQRVGHHQDRVWRRTVHCFERPAEIGGLTSKSARQRFD